MSWWMLARGGGAEAFLRAVMEVDLRRMGEEPLILYRPQSDSVRSQYAVEETRQKHVSGPCKYLMDQSHSRYRKTTGTQQPSQTLWEKNAHSFCDITKGLLLHSSWRAGHLCPVQSQWQHTHTHTWLMVGSLVRSIWKTGGGSVCCSTCSSCCGWPHTAMALVRWSTPLS